MEHLLKDEVTSPDGIRQMLLSQGEDSHISAIMALTNYIKSKAIPNVSGFLKQEENSMVLE